MVSFCLPHLNDLACFPDSGGTICLYMSYLSYKIPVWKSVGYFPSIALHSLGISESLSITASSLSVPETQDGKARRQRRQIEIAVFQSVFIPIFILALPIGRRKD